jgi:hypothetical protein
MNAFESPHLPGEERLPGSLEIEHTYPIAGEVCPESDIRRHVAIIPVPTFPILVDLPAYIFSPHLFPIIYLSIAPHSHCIEIMRLAKAVYGLGNGAVA